MCPWLDKNFNAGFFSLFLWSLLKVKSVSHCMTMASVLITSGLRGMKKLATTFPVITWYSC